VSPGNDDVCAQGRYRLALVEGGGVVGGEFLRLALGHPCLQVVQVTSRAHAGQPVAARHPNLWRVSDLRFAAEVDLDGVDVLVYAGAAAGAAPWAAPATPGLRCVLDLSSACRFSGGPGPMRAGRRDHACPEADVPFACALPERERTRLSAAGRSGSVTRLRVPGPVATAVVLALAPLLRGAVVARRDVVVEARLGSSAAAPGADDGVTFPSGHPEAETIAALLPGGLQVHLSTVASGRVRGVGISAHVWLHDGSSEGDVRAAFEQAYADEPFVRLIDRRAGPRRYPDPRLLDGTNWCDIGWRLDPGSGRVVVLAALDNLGKGSAGQGLQVLNLALGFDERAGLGFPGVHP